MLLQPELVLEDVSQDHARKTVRYSISIDYGRTHTHTHKHMHTLTEFAIIYVNVLFSNLKRCR